MILKSAIRQLKKNKFMNTLIVIQFAAVMTLLCVLVSMVKSRMVYYKPFADEINSQGFLCQFEDADIAGEKGILENLKGTKCEFTYMEQFPVNINSDNVTIENENIYVPYTDILSDKWINAYTPRMQSGSWLNDLPDDGYIHVVVTQDNKLGLKTDDIITLHYYDFDNEKDIEEKAKVIGVMENKQYLVGFSSFQQTDIANHDNFFDMYYTYNSEVEACWGLCVPKSELEQSRLYQGDFAVEGMGIVMCNGMSDSEMKEVYNFLATNGSSYISSLEKIRENSFAYIYEQLYILLPIAICIFLLTLITTISVISISINKQLKTYATFYICGAKWRECAFISFLYSLIVCIISGVISLAAIFIISKNSLTVINLGIFEVAAMLVAVIIYLILSAVMPLVIIGKTQPKEILNKEE